MEITEFCQKVKRHLEEQLGSEALVSIKNITKNSKEIAKISLI